MLTELNADGVSRLTFLPVQVENRSQEARTKQHGSTGPHCGWLPPELFSRGQSHNPRKQTGVEPCHEETHILHQHRDQAEQQACPQRYPCN
jgi:hypothetical protein